MSVLVTGAAGFIGSHLVRSLLRQGEKVVGVDNFDPFYSRSIKESNLLEYSGSKQWHFLEADIRNQDLLEKLFVDHKITTVIHLAAKAGVRPSLEDPRGYLSTNVDGTLALLEVCRKVGVHKFIFASSSSVYGRNVKVPFQETDILEEMISPYATSKLSGENYTRLYHNLYDLGVINLRFFTVYGPSQRPDLAIHKFMKANVKNEPITVFGDGSMARDYTFVADTVQGILGALKLIESRPNIYETYNLGHSTPITLNELLSEIEKISGKAFMKKFAPVPLGDVPQTFADISKAKRDLGYAPNYPLGRGLQEMWNWLAPFYYQT